MRLSDAGLRQRPTKLIYPNHRLPPWLNEDATRDRSNRLLGAVATLDRNFLVELNVINIAFAPNRWDQHEIEICSNNGVPRILIRDTKLIFLGQPRCGITFRGRLKSYENSRYLGIWMALQPSWIRARWSFRLVSATARESPHQ